MKKSILLMAAMACQKVYEKSITIGASTDYDVFDDDPEYQILAFTGSSLKLNGWKNILNTITDWMWNATLLWRDSVKLCNYVSVHRVRKVFTPDPNKKLIVTGHSKAGPNAPYWIHKFGRSGDIGVSIEAPPAFRGTFHVDNCIGIIDPNDPVTKMGELTFNHPDIQFFYLPDDGGIDIDDHRIERIISFLKNNPVDI